MAHLTDIQRRIIEIELHNRSSFTQIAKKIGKNRSTVMREIAKNSVVSYKGAPGRVQNRCILRHDCKIQFLCEGFNCFKECRKCAKCNTLCKKFREELCDKLDRAPYVCNGCPEELKCVLKKKFYIHDKANQNYRTRLSEARKGACISETELDEIDRLIEQGSKLGQSIHHIFATNADKFIICEKTIYRYINDAILLRTKRHHLPRAGCMKPRRKKSKERKIDKKCREGRKLEDFKKFCAEKPDLPTVEIDSVIGKIGGKVLLTMQLNNCGLMLAFIRENNTSQSVIDVFNDLEKRLGSALFKKLFPIILTDNGCEFSNPQALEASSIHTGNRTKIFYCDPYSSWQKPNLENNHTNLRRIFEKGKSFENYTQKDVNLAISHLNSYARKSFNNITAIKMFETIYGEGILQKIGIKLIEPEKVILHPKLLKKTE